MIHPPASVRVYLCLSPCDMRRSFDGLHALVRDHLQLDPARIRYSAIDPTRRDGRLIYIKPMMLGNEPPDVSTHQASHPDFPHQGTGNQWYDES